ncbi:MAG TPA: hypothetical protein PKW82_03340, partial [Spirochaetales bacterium]|nr:hypothetical protein [Spirochaetales bacterium]
RGRQAAAGMAILAAAVLAGFALAACGKPAPRSTEAVSDPSYADGLILYLTGAGLENSADLDARTFAPAHEAGFIAALASADGGAALAINRAGAVLLELDARTRTLRKREYPTPEFEGRTVGSMFVDDGGDILVSLYRHPDENSPDSGGSLLRLDPGSGIWSDEGLPAPIDAASVYAMHRLEDGRILVATRRAEGDRIEAARWLVRPDGKVEPLSLADFESLLAPRPARLAPPALRAALGSLVEETGGARILAYARNPRGDGTWYALGDGAPESTVEVVAAIDESGTVAFATFPEGPAKTASFKDGLVELSDVSLVAPSPGATWNGALIHGDSEDTLVLLLSWWVERFPDSAGSGLLVRPLAGPGRASAL